MNNKIQPIIVCSACSHFVYRNSFLIIFWLSSKCKFNLLHTCTYVNLYVFVYVCTYNNQFRETKFFMVCTSSSRMWLLLLLLLFGCQNNIFCVCVCVYLLKVKLFESVKLLITIINLVFAMYCAHITYVQYEKYYFHTHMNTSVCRPLSLFFWFRPIVCYHNLLLCHVVHTVFEWMYLKNVFTYRCMYMCVSRWQPCITRCFHC